MACRMSSHSRNSSASSAAAFQTDERPILQLRGASTAPAPAAAPAPAPAPIVLAAPPRPASHTTAMTTLEQMRVVRVPALRSGRQVNTVRPVNYEAWLGQSRGSVQQAVCTHCSRGNGTFTECVVVAGMFGGSCTNCHYGSEGARCSLRSGKFADLDI